MKALKSLFVGTLFFSQFTWASFSEKRLRYLAPPDLVSILVRYFPEVTQLKNDPNNCFAFETDSSEWGVSQPLTGTPAYEKPNAAFLGALGTCLKISFDFYAKGNLSPAIAKKLIQRFWASDLTVAFRLNSDNDYKNFLKAQSLSISKEQKMKFIRQLILKLIGPEPVLLDFGFVKSQSDLEKRILESSSVSSEGTVLNWMAFVITAVMSRDEFLKY